MLSNFDQRMAHFQGAGGGGFKSSANAATRGRGGGSRSRGSSCNKGRSGDSNRGAAPPHSGGRGRRGRGAGGGGRNRPDTPKCQICGKVGHTAKDCWYRYEEDDYDSQDEEKVAAAANGSYGVDTNWYVDSGATNHITNELEKVTMKEKYRSKDQIHTASGEGMSISHFGHSIFRTPHRNIHLRKILHVPSANKSLLSVHRIALDNHVFLEFHPLFFLIKDQATRTVLYRGRCVGGLYLLIPEFRGPNKYACGAIKLSSTRWHDRLGHASFSLVENLLRKNNLPFVGERHNETICDSCQKAKSHQLPYPTSSSVSTKPLQLIFSDVWGPAPTSVGRHTYYVSFIDDFSKFSWIYLLKKRSDVFQVFKNFQALVERKFDSKIIAVQSD
uniref:Retrovirus-related Pol polyprotein from transposon TNT 1-94 n=1 Tax=Triticum urartu TaxID=4572 RepID=A0A8R7VE00_TRIUA